VPPGRVGSRRRHRGIIPPALEDGLELTVVCLLFLPQFPSILVLAGLQLVRAKARPWVTIRRAVWWSSWLWFATVCHPPRANRSDPALLLVLRGRQRVRMPVMRLQTLSHAMFVAPQCAFAAMNKALEGK
jgi:hypothetical protein